MRPARRGVPLDEGRGTSMIDDICVFCDRAITKAEDGAWEDSSGACGCGDGEHRAAQRGGWGEPDRFGNYDPPEELLDHWDDRR